MQLFLHTHTRIRILNGDQEWTGTPDEFRRCEPEYPGLPILTQAPAVIRYQTPEWKYIEDVNGGKHPDVFNALPYCANIAAYIMPTPIVWIHHTLTAQAGAVIFQPDGVPLLRNVADDVLRITSTVRASADHDSPIIDQLQQAFPIRVCYCDGREAFIKLVSPIAPGVYQYDLSFFDKLPVRHRLFDSTFTAVEVDGVTYAFQQVTPLIIDVYEP